MGDSPLDGRKAPRMAHTASGFRSIDQHHERRAAIHGARTPKAVDVAVILTNLTEPHRLLVTFKKLLKKIKAI